MLNRVAALQLGIDSHLLDHIAPLSFALKIPLLISDHKVFELCQKYYPDIQSQYLPDEEMTQRFLVDNFDLLFQCKFWKEGFSQFLEKAYGKKLHLIFCPHGHSEKGLINTERMLAPYLEQDGVLLYGEGLKALLKKVGLFNKLKHFVEVGNYRLLYFLKHYSFYQKVIEETVALPKQNKTVLYAPTWNDAEGSTSFFEIYPKLLEQLPPNLNLIVRPHPLLELRDTVRFYTTLKETKRENLLVLLDFPPVYPLLEKVDCLLGDFSSMSYDFLYFKKPLFFFNCKKEKQDLLIYKCGKVIPPAAYNHLFSFIQEEMEGEHTEINSKKSDLYHHTFGDSLTFTEIEKRVQLFQKELIKETSAHYLKL